MNTIRLVYEIQADAPATWPAATHGVRNQFVPVHDPQRDPSGLGLLASLVRYCLGDVPDALNDAVAALLQHDELVLPGGIEVVQDSQVIRPSCCCGLEDWQDWYLFRAEAGAPWLGHDPSPSWERLGRSIRLWSDDPTSAPASHPAFYIDLSQEELEAALAQAERDVHAWLDRLEQTLAQAETPQRGALMRVLRHTFSTEPPVATWRSPTP